MELIREFCVPAKKLKIKNQKTVIAISNRKSMRKYYLSHDSYKNLIIKRINFKKLQDIYKESIKSLLRISLEEKKGTKYSWLEIFTMSMCLCI